MIIIGVIVTVCVGAIVYIIYWKFKQFKKKTKFIYL